MNQPMQPTRRAAWDIEDMVSGTDAVLDVEKMLEQMGGLGQGVNHTPTDAVAKVLYAMFSGQRETIDWLIDLTLRAPYPHVGEDFQSAALAAAKHQARAGIGEVIVAAIARGKQIIDQEQKKDQTNA